MPKFLIDVLGDSDGDPLMHVYTYFNEAFAITFLAPGGNLAGCHYWRNNGVVDENFSPRDVWLENDWRNQTMDVWGNAYSKAMNTDKKMKHNSQILDDTQEFSQFHNGRKREGKKL